MPMSALHKLKAYFGMVPADEVDDYDDEVGYRERYADSDRDTYDGPADRGTRRRVGTRGGYQAEADAEPDFVEDYREPPASRPRRQWAAEPPARSSALPTDQPRENVSRLRAVTDTGTQFNLSKITTLHPRSYSEARTIGEQYRDGTPVIMNLTEMEEADAKRLVDFAAGLAFALRGSIEKVTNRVFLLSPPNVDVAAEDKRRLAEGAFFNYG
ncbi:cell division inhibitor SepF [Saccharopolyspora kobensis]|uniref:Cell division protein SepF n=2 Tax=Saccharopolyspora kobensis TaxID=146035 RepID=A0A1H6C0B3_9PSEU|nr:cell division inhibitor SepF [Saccharopolyspora kobensis]SFC22694.1 cell division inhibitor SepF [Saccharopolyspora kobensis]